MNSAKLWNLTNHWSMNWWQRQGHLSHSCLAGPVLASCIGGSKGGARDAPPGGPNSFIFMQFSAKIWKIIAILGVSTPPWGKSWIRHCRGLLIKRFQAWISFFLYNNMSLNSVDVLVSVNFGKLSHFLGAQEFSRRSEKRAHPCENI